MRWDVLKWLFDKLWKTRPWEEGYHKYTIEIISIVGIFLMFIGVAVNTYDWYSVAFIAFASGLMAGSMINHALEKNREKGWAWR